MGWLAKKYVVAMRSNHELSDLCARQGRKLIEQATEIAELRRKNSEMSKFLRLVGHDMFKHDFPIPAEFIEED